MGIIDDYYGGYENLGMHVNEDGDIDYDEACDSANFGGGYGSAGGSDDEEGYISSAPASDEDPDDSPNDMPASDEDLDDAPNNPQPLSAAALAKERQGMLMPARDELWQASSSWFALRTDHLQFGGDPLERIRKSFPDVRHLIYETCGAIDTRCVHAVFPNLVSLVVYPGNGQGPTEGSDFSALGHFTQLRHFELRCFGWDWYDCPGDLLEDLGKLPQLQHVHISGTRCCGSEDWKALEKLPPSLETLSFWGENDICVIEKRAELKKNHPSIADVGFMKKPVPMPPELLREFTVDLSHLVKLKSAYLVGGDFCSVEELAAGAALEGQALVLPTSLRELTLGLPQDRPSDRFDPETYEPIVKPRPDYYGYGGGGCTVAFGAELDRRGLQRLECQRDWVHRTLQQRLVDHVKEKEDWDRQRAEWEKENAERKAMWKKEQEEESSRSKKEGKRVVVSQPPNGGKKQRMRGSSSTSAGVLSGSGPESERTCEVCKKVLKTIGGKANHKRDVHGIGRLE